MSANVVPIRQASARTNGKRRIDARQAVSDIRLGLADDALMNKYRLSADGLQSFFKK